MISLNPSALTGTHTSEPNPTVAFPTVSLKLSAVVDPPAPTMTCPCMPSKTTSLLLESIISEIASKVILEVPSVCFAVKQT